MTTKLQNKARKERNKARSQKHLCICTACLGKAKRNAWQSARPCPACGRYMSMVRINWRQVK